MVLIALNILSGLIVFITSICHLSRKKWKLNQMGLWAFSLSVAGAVGIIISSLHNQIFFSEVMFNFGVAVHFALNAYALFKPKLREA